MTGRNAVQLGTAESFHSREVNFCIGARGDPSWYTQGHIELTKAISSHKGDATQAVVGVKDVGRCVRVLAKTSS